MSHIAPLVRLATTFGLVAAAGIASAQTGPGDALNAASAALQAVDQSRGAAIYTGSPTFVRSAIKQPDFVGGLTRERAKLPANLTRSWTAVERVIIADNTGGLPPGTVCANVNFASLAGTALVGAERVSLCQQDNKWLPTGYQAIAITQASAPK